MSQSSQLKVCAYIEVLTGCEYYGFFNFIPLAMEYEKVGLVYSPALVRCCVSDYFTYEWRLLLYSF